jgi:hypothetical protein
MVEGLCLVIEIVAPKAMLRNHYNIYPGFMGHYKMSAKRMNGHPIYSQFTFLCERSSVKNTDCLTNVFGQYDGRKQGSRRIYYDHYEASWKVGEKVGALKWDLQAVSSAASPELVAYGHNAHVPKRAQGEYEAMKSGWYYSIQNQLAFAPDIQMRCIKRAACHNPVLVAGIWACDKARTPIMQRLGQTVNAPAASTLLIDHAGLAALALCLLAAFLFVTGMSGSVIQAGGKGHPPPVQAAPHSEELLTPQSHYQAVAYDPHGEECSLSALDKKAGR